MSYSNDPNRPPDREDQSRYREGYVEGRDASARGGSNAALGFLLGIVILALLGLLGWFLIGRDTTQTPESETNIINVPAPEAPEAPQPNIEQPDVNITVPSPDLEGASPETGDTNTAPNTPDTSP
jgi:cytoskeletal protein RodZ